MTSSLTGWLKGLCARVLQRLQATPKQRRMELIETLNLGGKRQLLLVVCDGHDYLIGAGGDSVHSIEQIRSATEVDVPERNCYRSDEDRALGPDTRRLH
jgi:hypothetical protein